ATHVAVPAAPSVQGLAPSVWNDEYQAQALQLAAEVRDRRHANYDPNFQEKLLLADALMHAVVSAAGMPPASHESERESVRREVIEECAKIAETVLVKDFERKTGQLRGNSEAEVAIAEAIRALASPATPAPEGKTDG